MSEQLKKDLVNNPLLLDFFNTGAAQRASVEDFAQTLIAEIIAVVKIQQTFAETQLTYSDTDKSWCAAKVIQSKKIIAVISIYCNNLIYS